MSLPLFLCSVNALELSRSVRAIEETLLSVFIRACSLESQAGYSERAVAAFQALIEFNCFRPQPVRKRKGRTGANQVQFSRGHEDHEGGSQGVHLNI